MTITDEPQNLRSQPIDKERLRRKYMEERNKRLRADGNDQYIEDKGQLAHDLDEPDTPVKPREQSVQIMLPANRTSDHLPPALLPRQIGFSLHVRVIGVLPVQVLIFGPDTFIKKLSDQNKCHRAMHGRWRIAHDV